MKYRDAKRLHKDDEVCIKKTKAVQTVLFTEVFEKKVIVYCDDMTRYTHTEIQ